MPLLPVLLVLVLLAVAGASFFAALMQARKARRELEAHMGLIAHRGAALASDDTPPFEVPETGWRVDLAIRLRRGFTLGLSHNWGMRAGSLVLLTLAIGGGLGAWLLLHSSLHFSAMASGGAAFVACFAVPRMWLKHEQKSADQQFVALFPDAVDMMIRMLRAGMPVTAAIRAVGAEAAPPVNRVFARIADQMQIGIAFEDALATAARQVGLPDFRFFAVSISLQRATGGNLAVTLDILSDIMRKRRAMRLKGRAVTGEVRMSAYVLGAMPFLVIGVLVVVSPDYLLPLLTDRRGNIIIGIATLSMTVGFVTIRQMMRSVTQV